MNKILAMLTAMLMLAAIFVPAVSGAQVSNAGADTMVTIDGANVPPLIEFKFELDDDIPLDGHTDVIPEPLTDQAVDLYAVVSDPSGVTDINRVEFKVWYPGVTPNPTGTGLQNWLIGTYLDWDVSADQAEIMAILDRAVTQGILTSSEAYDLDAGIVKHLSNYEWRFYKGQTTLKYYDVAGDYTVRALGIDNQGSTPVPLDNNFTYISIKSIALDLQTVDYLTLASGNTQVISGNYIWDDNNKGTIWNQGNDPFKLKISSTDMTTEDFQYHIPADTLDSTVYGVVSYAVGQNGFADLGASINENNMLGTTAVAFDIPVIPPDRWDPIYTPIFTPGNTPATSLITGQFEGTGIRPIDWSMHVPGGTVSGIYGGTVTIEVVPVL